MTIEALGIIARIISYAHQLIDLIDSLGRKDKKEIESHLENTDNCTLQDLTCLIQALDKFLADQHDRDLGVRTKGPK